MATNIITSHHNLEREVSSDIANGAPHRVRCLTCKTGEAMTLYQAAKHATKPVEDETTTYRLFTLFP